MDRGQTSSASRVAVLRENTALRENVAWLLSEALPGPAGVEAAATMAVCYKDKGVFNDVRKS